MSARSLSLPTARLFATKSALPITGTSISEIRTTILFETASSNETPETEVRMSILLGGSPIWKTRSVSVSSSSFSSERGAPKVARAR